LQGDALIVVWPDTDSDVPTRVRRAAQCALQIQQNLHAAEVEKDVRLSIKLGIGVGKVSIIHVGGVLSRVEYLVTGDPLLQVCYLSDGFCISLLDFRSFRWFCAVVSR
jgi:class 3 adenylate cyclase